MSDMASYIGSHGEEITGPASVVSAYRRIERDQQAQERAWVAELRELGVKAAHPDDAWVDRHRDRVRFCYPQFDDGPEAGDLIALGVPWRQHRLVRVTSVEVRTFLMRSVTYSFEPAE